MADAIILPAVEAAPVLSHLHSEMAASKEKPASLRECPIQAQWNLRGDAANSDFAAAVENALGISLPDTPNTARRSANSAILWLGPDEWLITSADEKALTLVLTRLTENLGELHHALTDISDNRTVLELSGNAAKEVLATGCGLDLSQWQNDQCAQTNFAQAQILLQQIDDAPTIRIYVRNSFADYLSRFMLAEIADLS